MESLEGAAGMTIPNSGPTSEWADDLDRIERALSAAVRDALQRHKRDGDPVAVWREGRVVRLPADQIPTATDETSENTGDRTSQ
jgi:hypothetical protein